MTLKASSQHFALWPDPTLLTSGSLQRGTKPLERAVQSSCCLELPALTKLYRKLCTKDLKKKRFGQVFFSWCDWMGTAVLGTWGLLQFVHIFEGTGSPPAFKGSREPSGAVQDLGTSHILGNYMFLSTDIELPMLSNSGSIP